MREISRGSQTLRYEFLKAPLGGPAKESHLRSQCKAICTHHLWNRLTITNLLGNHVKRRSKEVWARGGCLGAGSRRRARQAAIVPGEAQTAFDPGVPEWGNPPGAMPRHPPLNQIGGEEATRGTETSKYPEEEKSTEIPPVAASESGRRPNRSFRHSFRALGLRGCGGERPGA